MIFITLENFVFFKEERKKLQPQNLYSVKNLTNKITLKNNQFIIDYIENLIAKQDIFIEGLKTTEHTFSFSINGSFDTIIQFLYRLEQHFIIEEFFLKSMDIDNSKIQCRIVFLNHYFLNQDQKDNLLQNIINPFVNQKKTLLTSGQKSIQLDAIVLDEVFIAGEWYKKGDMFLGYQIVHIEPKVIKLMNNQTNKIKIIKLEDDEK
jgi:hypothetical protein